MPTGFPRRVSLSTYLAFAVLVALSASVKATVWQLPPQIFNDSAGYVVPAVSLLDGRGYGAQENGFRTPTYPLFLTVILASFDRTHLSQCQDAHGTACLGKSAQTVDGGSALRAVAAVQIAVGLLTTAVLVALGLRLTRNTIVALLFGAGYALNVATAFWEISILTETLTTFLLALAVYLTLRAENAHGITRLALGVTLGFLALCHQLFIAYWILPAAFLFARAWSAEDRVARNNVADAATGHNCGRGRFTVEPSRYALLRKALHRMPRILGLVSPVFLIPLFFIAAWSTYNYIVNGYFTPSTLSGYVLIQMVGPVVQNAPSGYDGITQPYVGFRDALISETGSHSGAIFRAWPAMMNWTGLTWSQLSQKLTTLTLYLIIHYPQTYFQIAREGWARFWDFAFYHLSPVPTAIPQWALWFVDPILQAFLTILFWLSSAGWGTLWLRWRRAKSVRFPFAAGAFVMSTVWLAAVIVALTNFQDNSRMHTYVLPLQSASIVLIIWAVARTALFSHTIT